ncbi:hypothetical protein [Methylobacterium sp. J-070]|uniref:hypothetical protein n=1 Tax=Methylobacterium sp. J-070 TaxID=2836650 RepID=UPI001FBA3BB0|nr:hypothetical protein [Methylobacterium sp. J-070]MCJ2050672.1 hypothetical protein [Methylobacterium sp. J-070]
MLTVALPLAVLSTKASIMGSGISLLFLALGTIGGVGLLALAARKRVADLKGDPERSSLIKDHGGEPRPNMPGTEH